MAVCPRCGSHNYSYKLRSAGTRSTTNYYRTGVKNSWIVPAGKRHYQSNKQQKTVGFCSDCGYSEEVKERGCLWYLFLLCIWPIALSIWFYKTPLIRIGKIKKILIIVAIWILLGVISSSLGETETRKENNTVGKSFWQTEITFVEHL